MKPELQQVVDDLLREQLCLPCDPSLTGECSDRATCSADEEICIIDGTSECEPLPLGIEGGLMLGDLIGDFTQEPDAEVDLIVRVADHAKADDGLQLAARTGFQHTDLTDCAPIDPTTRPPLGAIPISPTINGNTNPRTGEPFMVGIGINEQVIEQAIWTIWASGGLCIAADSAVTDNLLTTDLLATLLRLNSIKGVADREKRDIVLRVVPQGPADVVLGANRLSGGPGAWTVEEPLMTIDWKDFDISFYAYVQDRYALLFTVRVDLLIPMAIAPDGMGSIEVILGDLEAAFTNTRVINQGLLTEPKERVEDSLPQLVGLAVGQLAGDLTDSLAFELPAFAGLQLKLDEEDITSVDNDTFIALFASLEVAPAMPTSLEIPPMARIEEITVEYTRDPSPVIEMPEVTIDVAAALVGLATSDDPDSFEYSWRVRNGIWSNFAPGTTQVVDDPVLMLPGRHALEVRARRIGDTHRGGDVALGEIVIDYQAPELELERSGALVRMLGTDLTDGIDLEYRWRIHDGEGVSAWTAWTRESELDLSTVANLPARVRFEAEARDAAGHTTRAQQTMSWRSEPAPAGAQPAEPANGTSSDRAMGCAQSAPGAPTGSLAWLALALGMFGLSRRRQVLAGIMALTTATLASGCGGCTDNSGETTVCGECAEGEVCDEVSGECREPVRSCGTDDECRDGEICSANTCVPAECQQDSDCDDGCESGKAGVCNSGVCGCADICPEGCGEGEFCCYASGSRGCQATPDPCDGQMCDPGFGPAIQNPGTANSETCQLDGGSCGCEPLPPLPLGYNGRYLDIAREGGDTVVAGYNQTYGDLIVGALDGTNVTWQFVDGVPDSGDIEGALDGPRGGIKDAGEDVGRWAAIELDASGVAHVFYRDVAGKALKYARGSQAGGAWTFDIAVLDDDGDAGWWTKAEIVGTELHVVYSAVEVESGDAGPRSEVRHVVLDPTQKFSEQSVTPAVVMTGPSASPCGGSCGDGEECVLSTNQCAAPAESCPSTCETGSSCIAGACEPTVIPGGPGTLARLSATDLDLSVQGDTLSLVFYDAVQRRAGWTRLPAGGAWSAPAYLDAASGPSVSGVFDDAGTLHVAYMDEGSYELYYRAGAQGAPERIANGVRDDGTQWVKAPIGDDVSLRLRADGQPEIVYHDATFHRLYTARRDGGGQWSVSALGQASAAEPGSHGFYTTVLRDSGATVAGEYVIINGDGNAEGRAVFHALD